MVIEVKPDCPISPSLGELRKQRMVFDSKEILSVPTASIVIRLPAKNNLLFFRGLEKPWYSLERTLARRERFAIFRYLSGDLLEALQNIYKHESKNHTGAFKLLDLPQFGFEPGSGSSIFPSFSQLRNNPSETIRMARWLRHYGFPSPLLDWSENPYVSGYFAVGNASDPSLKKEDFVIYAVNRGRMNKLLEGKDPGNEDLLHPSNLLRWMDPNESSGRLPGRESNQEATYLWTSLKDLEGFIRWMEECLLPESERNDPERWILRRFRFDAKERDSVREFLEREKGLSLYMLYGDEDHFVQDLVSKHFGTHREF